MRKIWAIGIIGFLAYSLFVHEPKRITDFDAGVELSERLSKPDNAADSKPRPARQPISNEKPQLAKAPVELIFAFVKGNRVALRESPDKKSNILDRLETGHKVEILKTIGDWKQIREPLSRRTGWVASYLLADRRQETAPKPSSIEIPKQPSPVNKPVAPAIPDDLIIQKIIATSMANYGGNCACPENRDRAGRRCGKRSAYSKPGGASPLCYVEDVSQEMIKAFRGAMN